MMMGADEVNQMHRGWTPERNQTERPRVERTRSSR
jgi:hypothetical protein